MSYNHAAAYSRDDGALTLALQLEVQSLANSRLPAKLTDRICHTDGLHFFSTSSPLGASLRCTAVDHTEAAKTTPPRKFAPLLHVASIPNKHP